MGLSLFLHVITAVAVGNSDENLFGLSLSVRAETLINVLMNFSKKL